MNAALPLPLYPAHLIRGAKLALGLLGALWASLLIGVYFIGVPPGAATLDSMVLVACVAQVFAVMFQGQALGRSVAVLQTQRAPAALWKAWLRQWLLSVTRFWAVLCLGLSLLLATPTSSLPWLVAPALLSLLLCLGVPAGLARAGLLPRRAGIAIECAMVALTVYAGVVEIPAALAQFAALPAPVLALCALGWPVMAYGLMVGKTDAVRTVLGPQTQVLRRLGDACGRWIGRFQPIREWHHDLALGLPNRRTMLMLALVQNLIFFGQLFPVYWDGQAGAARVAQLAIVCSLCSNTLLVRDVHWRALLLPRGPQLRRLGTRIVLSTLMFQAPLALLFALGCAMMLPPSNQGWHSVAIFAIPMLELACCTSLMAVLRALPKRAQIGAAILLPSVIGYAYIPHWFKLDVPEISWRIGPAYVLVLAGIIGAALWTANRLWTPRRLLNAVKIG